MRGWSCAVSVQKVVVGQAAGKNHKHYKQQPHFQKLAMTTANKTEMSRFLVLRCEMFLPCGYSLSLSRFGDAACVQNERSDENTSGLSVFLYRAGRIHCTLWKFCDWPCGRPSCSAWTNQNPFKEKLFS